MLSRARYLATGAAAGALATSVLSELRERAPLGKTALPLVRLCGQVETPSGTPSISGLSLSRAEPALSAAFRMRSPAVVLEINSPGGSPAQSALLHARLQQLKKEYPETKLLCYCTEVCASGGYYIASACDEIHVLPSSIIGSIGVVSPSLGLVELLKNWGIEDRTLTAGSSKTGDSPLRPRDAKEVQKKTRLLEELHDDFKAKVTAARGARLKHAEAAAYARKAGDYKSWSERREALFDGSVFAGKKAVEFGLADGLYDDLVVSLKERFGPDIRICELKTRQGFFERLQALQVSMAATQVASYASAARAELARQL